MKQRNIRFAFVLAVAAVWLAAGLRFYRLEAQSFWNDEGNSARIAERSPRLIVEGAAGDIHPPGYYLLLAAWRSLAGDSEFALRAVSTLAGVVLVALVYRLGRAYFDPPAALIAAGFAAIHPALIYYSQEARMYSLAAALGAAVFLLMTRWLIATRTIAHGFRITHYWRVSLAYILIAVAGLYTHYSFAFVLAAVNLAAVGGMAFHRRELFRARAVRWLLMQLAVLGLFAPWLPIALRQVTTWPSERTYAGLAETVLGMARWLAFGPVQVAALTTWGLIGLAVLLVLGLRRGGQTITPLIWLAVPVGLTAGLGLFSPVFAKFLLIAVPALCLFFGNGAAALFASRVPTRRARRARPAPTPLVAWGLGLVAALGLGLTAGPMELALSHLYGDPAFARADYRGIARGLEAEARPGDAVLLNAANQWEVFTYYHREGAPVYPIPRARPADPAQVEAELAQISAEHERLFVLWWGEAQADPERLVETWLAQHAFKALDNWYGDVRLSTYAVATSAPEVDLPLNAQFGEAIRLRRFALQESSMSPGDIIALTLYWQLAADAGQAPAYKVFAHLTALDNVPLAQHDSEPEAGLRPTTSWGQGETIEDRHGIIVPGDLASGDYRLVVGVYGVADGQRLPVSVNGQTQDDSLYLTDIQIK